jgi:hypothetical protein
MNKHTHEKCIKHSQTEVEAGGLNKQDVIPSDIKRNKSKDAQKRTRTCKSGEARSILNEYAYRAIQKPARPVRNEPERLPSTTNEAINRAKSDDEITTLPTLVQSQHIRKSTCN